MSLEKFIKGEPINERMEKLMRGVDDADEIDVETAITRRDSFADGTPITNHDRDHLRRMLGSAGWQVLMKLLDTSLQHQEDAARRISVDRTTPKDDILTAWADLAGAKTARNKILALAENEVEKLSNEKRRAKTAKV